MGDTYLLLTFYNLCRFTTSKLKCAMSVKQILHCLQHLFRKDLMNRPNVVLLSFSKVLLDIAIISKHCHLGAVEQTSLSFDSIIKIYQ